MRSQKSNYYHFDNQEYSVSRVFILTVKLIPKMNYSSSFHLPEYWLSELCVTDTRIMVVRIMVVLIYYSDLISPRLIK